MILPSNFAAQALLGRARRPLLDLHGQSKVRRAASAFALDSARDHPPRRLAVPSLSLSYRNVEEFLAERGISVAYESVRRWVAKFGPMFARNLRRLRPRPTGTWHLDVMVVTSQGRRMYLWRALDAEGEVLDLLVQSKWGTKAATGAA